jgi:chemotaxis protein MotB
MAERQAHPIIVRRVKKVVGHPPRRSWKVAYADFVTAMMAFFLVMWLMAPPPSRPCAISSYFRSASPLKARAPRPRRPAGPGGASSSMIKLGGTMDIARATCHEPEGRAQPVTRPSSATSSAGALMKDLQQAISKSQALEPFKDQLLLDLTPEGLRIQIVDKQNRPMFDLGGSVLKPYTSNPARAGRTT